jgi:hypothetical protein
MVRCKAETFEPANRGPHTRSRLPRLARPLALDAPDAPAPALGRFPAISPP